MSLARRITEHFGGDWHGDYGTFPTPGHSKKDRGMSVTDKPDAPDGVLINTHNGGDPLAVKDECRRIGILPERSTPTTTWRVTGTYEYHDAGGEAIYRTVRKEKAGEPKRFVAERRDGTRWVSGIDGVARVPYRLPQLLAAPADATVYFVEGERKADKLVSMGLTATAVAFGCKGWRQEYASHFAGRSVVILPDNDKDGKDFAEKVKAAVEAVAGSAIIVDLPGLPLKGDIINWTGTADDLAALVGNSKPEPKQAAYLKGISAAALVAKHFDPVRYVVNGLIAEGGTLFGGAPKIGKSWLGLDLALCVPTGRPLFGSMPVEQGDCLYLALEDSERRLRSRLLKKGVQAPDRLTLVTEWPDLDHGCIAELEAWAEEAVKPVLVIVDVLAMVRGSARPNESVYQADYRVMGALAAWARSRGIAVLVVHHVRKMAAEDPLESLSGTNGLTGAADTVMVLKRDNNGQQTGHCLLYVRGRDIEESEKAVRFKPDNGTWELLGNAEEVGRTNERQQILDTLRELGKPLTVREISDILGKNYDAVRKTLARMWKTGEVEKSGRGSYACPVCPNVPNTPEPDNRTHRTGGKCGEEERLTFPHGNPALKPILAHGDEDDDPFARSSPNVIGKPLF